MAVNELRAWRENLDGDLKLILFDLDGTLRHNVPSPTHFLFDYVVAQGIQDGDEKRRHIARWTHYYWAQSDELLQDVAQYQEMGDPFWINYIVRSLLEFNCSTDCAREMAPRVQDYMTEAYQSRDVVPEDVPETLRAFKRAGYRLALLSNRSQPCHEDLEQLGLSEYFELALVAGEVDAWKPDPAIFERTLQRLDVHAHEVVYVGDNYYADVIGAQRAGVEAILIDPEGVFPDANCPVVTTIGDLLHLV